MSGWKLADVWEAVAEQIPEAPALIHGDIRLTWAEVDRRADGLARWLLDRGLGEQAKVAQYLRNRPEYMESVFAAFKAGLVPVNTNYRYAGHELVHLWTDSETAAVVFAGEFGPAIEAVRAQVPGVRAWLWVDDGSGPCPEWAVPYEEAVKAARGRTVAPWGRSPDHLFLIYTGGTTGMPKGAMWRQADLFQIYVNLVAPGAGPDQDLEWVRATVATPGEVLVPACPLMHGTGSVMAVLTFSGGGCITTLTGRSFDPAELLDTVERVRASAVVIVGDPFARPIVARLDADPGRWDLSSVTTMVSSGAMWSRPVKEALLRHHPGLVIMDSFGSSEAVGLGMSVSTAESVAATGGFQLGPNSRVIDEAGREVVPGSGEIGLLCIAPGTGGVVSAGYYRDPERTARLFRTIDGVRYTVPGDYATVAADGAITLLGRGSQCINTGGEKVFAEEVEEVLKQHPAVRDAAVVGIPDERWGEAVCALVETEAEVPEPDLIGHVRARLASHKTPKRAFSVPGLARSPSGKLDYARLKAVAADLTRHR